MKTHIAEILQQEGYIAGWTTRRGRRGAGKTLIVTLKYGPNRERSIAGVRRVSQAGPAGLREGDQPAQGARRPRRRDHLHVGRSADRPAGRQAGRRRGSPRLRLVTGGVAHVANRTAAHPRARGVDVTIDGRDVTVKGPKGTLSHTVVEPITVERGRRHAAGHPARRRARQPGAARPDPHAGRQHGHRRHRGLLARRWRSSASVTACRPRAATWSSRSASATRSPVDAARGHLASRSRPRPASWSRASTSSRSARSRPTSARCASRSRTRARACGTRASRPPQGRKGWQVAMAAPRPSQAAPKRVAHAPPPAGPQEGLRHAGSVRAWSSPARSRHIYVQVVDDTAGHTLASASTLDDGHPGRDGDKKAKAAQVGKLVAERAKAAGIDRSSSTVVATATTAGSPRWPTRAREAGLEF